MPEPTSWLMIEPGWDVARGDGERLGRVDRVLADGQKDIFDGLIVSAALGRNRHYVPAAHVGRIVEGCVEVDLPSLDAAEAFDDEAPGTTGTQ